METTVNEPKGTTPPPFKENLEGPIRILVRTRTDLVPGADYGTRCHFMIHRICQQHWNRDFVFGEDRWYSYGNVFGYDGVTCYFVVDHGQSSADNDVPILWYEWTGESLLGPSVLTMSLFKLNLIQRKLRRYPFTKPPNQPRPKRAPPDTTARRKAIQSKLRHDILLADADFELMSDSVHARWLKDNVEEKFWLKFESLSQARTSDSLRVVPGGGWQGTRVVVPPIPCELSQEKDDS